MPFGLRFQLRPNRSGTEYTLIRLTAKKYIFLTRIRLRQGKASDFALQQDQRYAPTRRRDKFSRISLQATPPASTRHVALRASPRHVTRICFFCRRNQEFDLSGTSIRLGAKEMTVQCICIFRSKPNTDSDPSRTVIPECWGTFVLGVHRGR